MNKTEEFQSDIQGFIAWCLLEKNKERIELVKIKRVGGRVRYWFTADTTEDTLRAEWTTSHYSEYKHKLDEVQLQCRDLLKVRG